MICSETQRLLHAWLDNELDLRAALELEEHLAGCPVCGAEERAQRQLQESVRQNLLPYSNSLEIENRLRAVVRAAQSSAPAGSAAGHAAPAQVARPPPRSWKRAFAPAAAAAALLIFVAPRILTRQSEAAVEDAIILAHVRSLLVDHLTDVASSDQHTIKPWFQGKLNYSVPVTDWEAQGFPLVGGRLDYLQDAPTAALVFRRAQHVINLFVWPSKAGSDRPVERASGRGYLLYRWSQDGLNYQAISDLNEAELKMFVELERGKR